MSVYRCNRCENYYDQDHNGCELDPDDDCALICEGCAEDLACIECGEVKPGMKHCKITDLRYCESCV